MAAVIGRTACFVLSVERVLQPWPLPKVIDLQAFDAKSIAGLQAPLQLEIYFAACRIRATLIGFQGQVRQ